MLRVCFGTMFVLMYQARGQGIKSDPLCHAILESFGADLYYRDNSLPGHLKNGHDKVPGDIVETVRNCDPQKAVDAFEANVMPMIKDSMRKPLLSAVLAVLEDDNSFGPDTPISWEKGYTKAAALTASSIDLTHFLTALVRFSVLETDNMACADGIREIPRDFVKSFSGKHTAVELDETGVVIRSPGNEVKTSVIRNYITDAEILNDVNTLKILLSKYKRPDPLPVPVTIDDSEMVYVEALYAAYASAEDVPKYTRRDVERHRRYRDDFAYQRKCYYATETIRRSLQDALLPIEYKEFDTMREEVKSNIHFAMMRPYANGFLRLCAVTEQAANHDIVRSQIALLPGWISSEEKVGMCHMLANKKEIQWVDEDDGTV